MTLLELPMRRRTLVAVAAAALAASGHAPLYAQESFDRAMAAKIRDEGLNRSHVWQMVDTLATVIGPRLTASPAYMRAATWARDHLSGWGFSNVHFETWPFGRGWELTKYTLEMTEPRFAPMIGYPD